MTSNVIKVIIFASVSVFVVLTIFLFLAGKISKNAFYHATSPAESARAQPSSPEPTLPPTNETKKIQAGNDILNQLAFTSEDESRKAKIFQKIGIKTGGTEEKLANYLFFFPFGFPVKNGDDTKTYYSGVGTFSVTYPADWGFFPRDGYNIIFLSPETKPSPDGSVPYQKRAFTVSILADCHGPLRKSVPRYAQMSEYDSLLDVETGSSSNRTAPFSCINCSDKVTQYPNLGTADHFHWVAPHSLSHPPANFTGDTVIDDYFFTHKGGRYKISFAYNTQFKDKYWPTAERILESFSADDTACEQEKYQWSWKQIYMFFPLNTNHAGNSFSLGELVQQYSQEKTEKWLDMGAEQMAAEQKQWYR